MLVGIALLRTVYCVSPILAKPEATVRLCALTAFTMSCGVRPFACSLVGSISTMIWRYLPPSGCREGHSRHRRKLLAQAIDAVIVKLLLVESVGAQRELQH